MGAGLGADAVDHPDPERGLRPVLGGMDRGRVLVAVDARLERAPAVANEVEDEHPAAAEAELALAAKVLINGEEHPHSKQDEGHSDDPLEDRVDPRRKHRAEQERGDPENEHDRGVPECVERGEADGVALLVCEPGFSEGVHRTCAGGRVLVLVAAQLGGFVAVRGHRSARRHLCLGMARARCARDVGDGGDVVPVEAVPESERGHS